MQYPSVHRPLAPHWALVAQVPQVPATHAMPPPHWLFAVHAVHVPPMQARPCSGCGLWSGWLQSLKVEQAPHVPPMHACPIGQLPKGGLQPCA